jgi:5-methylcytosine-specific restriction enzyme A
VNRIKAPCLDCGNPTLHRPRCPECRRARQRQLKKRANKAYDGQWRKLSKRARSLQPWCSRCGATNNLTADHVHPLARGGKTRNLKLGVDVDVLCNRCNAAKGTTIAAAPVRQLVLPLQDEPPGVLPRPHWGVQRVGEAGTLTLTRDEAVR